LWQRGQEIAHLPPYAAAVLQAAGTKEENVSHLMKSRMKAFLPKNRLTPAQQVSRNRQSD
jgi:hypothetical protein